MHNIKKCQHIIKHMRILYLSDILTNNLLACISFKSWNCEFGLCAPTTLLKGLGAKHASLGVQDSPLNNCHHKSPTGVEKSDPHRQTKKKNMSSIHTHKFTRVHTCDQKEQHRKIIFQADAVRSRRPSGARPGVFACSPFDNS